MYKLQEISENEYSASIALCVEALKQIKPDQIISEGTIPENNLVSNLMLKLGLPASKDDQEMHCISNNIKKLIEFDEICKIISQEANRKKNKKENGKTEVLPDLIFHESLSNRSAQTMIMEVKSCSDIDQKLFNWDMYKLCQYVNELRFVNSIYLILYQKQETFQGRKNKPSKEKIINNKITKFHFKINSETGITEQEENAGSNTCLSSAYEKIRFILVSVDDERLSPKVYKLEKKPDNQRATARKMAQVRH